MSFKSVSVQPAAPSSASACLNTDFYQITMAAGYFQHQPDSHASFELYLRQLPAHRHFIVSAGLSQALQYLSDFSFSAEDVSYLKNHPALEHLPNTFFTALSTLRFTGDVDALAEGTLCFAHTPLLRITAPAMQAQLVETYLLALINYQSNVASKAARITQVLQKYRSGATHQAPTFIDFGSRRAQGPEAALHAARAAYIGGAVGTSNVAAGFAEGIPVTGTAAHAWTMMFDTEKEAFHAYHKTFPQKTILLVDTYDTLQGVKNAIEVAGKNLQGIRLDSGDFLSLSREARKLLDAAGLHKTMIMVSGDMNEHRIEELLSQGAPIDSFGVGTELTTCRDTPSLGGVYKLVERTVAGDDTPHYAIKSSASKISYPGKKQVWRYLYQGKFTHDIVSLGTAPPESKTPYDEVIPLLSPVMKQGVVLNASPSIHEIQAHVKQQLECLPVLPGIETAYPVYLDSSLINLYEEMKVRTTR